VRDASATCGRAGAALTTALVLAGCLPDLAATGFTTSTLGAGETVVTTDATMPPELVLTGVVDSPITLVADGWCSTGKGNQLPQDCETRSIAAPELRMFSGAELRPTFAWEPARITFIVYDADGTVLTGGSVDLPGRGGWAPQLVPGTYAVEVNARWNDASDAGYPFVLEVAEP